MTGYRYTIHLEVTVDGPDAEWREVADATAGRIIGAKIKGGFVLLRADVDTSDKVAFDEGCDERA